MSNSSLVVYTRLSPNKNSVRKNAIDTITVHCMAGNLSIEQCGNLFADSSRKASSNYGIGSDGRIGLYVNESERSWCSSNKANDDRAVTIEVANDGREPDWHVSDKALDSLIELCADICRRNNIKKLVWSTDKNQRVNHINGCNMTVHRDFANKACPGDYLYSKHQYIADEVNKRLGENTKMAFIETIKSVEDMYKFFVSNGMTSEGALLGNIQSESGFKSNNLQNSYERALGLDDVTYTVAVDNGAYGNFVQDKAGYGLCQWTFWNRKQNLLNYAKLRGASIGSMTMQCEFLINELKTSYRSVWNVLTTTKSVKEASDYVLTQFEKPARQDDTVKQARFANSNRLYELYETVKVDLNTMVPFLVKVSRTDLNVRDGAGTNYDKRGKMPVGTFTIVEVKQGQGSKLGWGRLKSGIGWISLDFVEIK